MLEQHGAQPVVCMLNATHGTDCHAMCSVMSTDCHRAKIRVAALRNRLRMQRLGSRELRSYVDALNSRDPLLTVHRCNSEHTLLMLDVQPVNTL